MSVRHLFGRENWYTIHTNYGGREGKPSWRSEHRWSVHTPRAEWSIAWVLFGRGFGFGFQAGRSGGDSDVGLNIYAGRLLSLWLRGRHPWLRWLRASKERHPKDWFYARHYGVRLFPHRGRFVTIELGARDGVWSRKHRWRELALTTTTILGRVRTETTTLDSGVARIPLPEGTYIGTWTKKRFARRRVRFPFSLLPARSHVSYSLDVEGGIPIEGKGENSWDCGMDGLFGCSGRSVEDAIGNAVSAVLRDRQRYGGPHDLPRPMSVTEAAGRSSA